MSRHAIAFCFFVSVVPSVAISQDVRITQDMAVFETTISGQTVTIERNQNQDNRLDNEFAKTSRKCPPFCITEMTVAEGVTTVGELEVMRFLNERVASGEGLLLDSRIPSWHEKGSIPGAVNVPFSTLDPSNPFRDRIFEAFGASQGADESWDFSGAIDLLMFCNGPWCDQSPTAIRNLIEAGYPADKLFYYRGGMTNWQLLGLTVTDPAEDRS